MTPQAVQGLERWAEGLVKRIEALESGRSGLDALKQTTARLDLVATRHDERLATLEHERGVRLLTALEAERERLRGEVSGVSPARKLVDYLRTCRDSPSGLPGWPLFRSHIEKLLLEIEAARLLGL